METFDTQIILFPKALGSQEFQAQTPRDGADKGSLLPASAPLVGISTT